MSQIDERRLGGLTILIDRHICVGFGDCVDLAPEIFELDGEGIAVVRVQGDDVDAARLVAACQACPVDALVVLDASGARLAP